MILLKYIPSGVPQGGHLSPLIFVISIGSIKHYLPFSIVLLFADDVKMYLNISSPSDFLKLQSDLNSFNDWTQDVDLTLNYYISKFHIMIFSRKHLLIFHLYYLNDTPLERIFAIKHFGFRLIPSLSFENHISIKIDKTLKALDFIKRNTSLFTFVSCLRVLHFSLTRSILEYGIVVWHPCLAKYLHLLERVQNRFLSYLVAFTLKIPHPQHDYTIILAPLWIFLPLLLAISYSFSSH